MRGLVLWMVWPAAVMAECRVDLRTASRNVYRTGPKAPDIPVQECDDGVGRNLGDTGSDQDVINLPIGRGGAGYSDALEQVRKKYTYRPDPSVLPKKPAPGERTHFWVKITVTLDDGASRDVWARVQKTDLYVVQVQHLWMNDKQRHYQKLNAGKKDITYTNFREALARGDIRENDINNEEWRRRAFLVAMVVSEAARFQWLEVIITNSLLNNPAATMRNQDYASIYSTWDPCCNRSLRNSRDVFERCWASRVNPFTGVAMKGEKISLLACFDRSGRSTPNTCEATA